MFIVWFSFVIQQTGQPRTQGITFDLPPTLLPGYEAENWCAQNRLFRSPGCLKLISKVCVFKEQEVDKKIFNPTMFTCSTQPEKMKYVKES